MDTLADRLATVHASMVEAATRAGRAVEDIELVAVSKTHPPEAVLEEIVTTLGVPAANT